MDRFESDESGQIIVIAALLLAVLFVGLALVLNSAIYAENIATRGETSTSDAMAVDLGTEDRLERSIHRANYYSDTASYEDRLALVHANVTEWDKLAGAREARSGHVYSVEESRMTEGTRVIQRDREELMPGDPDLADRITGLTLDPLGIEERTTWIPAPNATIRDFQLTVERDSLEATDENLLKDLGDLGDEILTGSSAFWIQTQRVNDDDHMWRIYLVDNTTNGSVEAVVTEIEEGGEYGDEDLEGICRAEGDLVTVNLTAGRMVGEDGTHECPVLTDAFGGERNNVYYVGGDEVTGSYQLMADVEDRTFRERVNKANSDDGLFGSLFDLTDCLFGDCDFDPDVYKEPHSGEEPYTTTAIYDVTIETTYQDGRITYTRNVTYPPTAR